MPLLPRSSYHVDAAAAAAVEEERASTSASTPPPLRLDDTNDENGDESAVISMAQYMCSDWNWLHIFYLSLFSTVGVTIRAFMGRFFGGDCESNSQGLSSITFCGLYRTPSV